MTEVKKHAARVREETGARCVVVIMLGKGQDAGAEFTETQVDVSGDSRLNLSVLLRQLADTLEQRAAAAHPPASRTPS